MLDRGLAATALLVIAAAAGAAEPHHYVFLGRERERISDARFLATPALEGAQIGYTWKELEPRTGVYDFAPIRADRAFLADRGKKLWVQLYDVTFDPSRRNVPPDVAADPQRDDRGAVEGWVARRWDPVVHARFRRLLAALGRELDGAIEGLNLCETSIGVSEAGPTAPPGFTYGRYRDAVIDTMRAARRAFPRSQIIQYANFMPGEWLPDDDHGYLASVYRAARELSVGVGGPDLLPGKPGQMHHAYRFMADLAGALPVGIAVQDGNYAYVNPRTGRRVTLPELVAFARDRLCARYVFWCTEEPYYSRDVIPFLAVPPHGPPIISPKGP